MKRRLFFSWGLVLLLNLVAIFFWGCGGSGRSTTTSLPANHLTTTDESTGKPEPEVAKTNVRGAPAYRSGRHSDSLASKQPSPKHRLDHGSQHRPLARAAGCPPALTAQQCHELAMMAHREAPASSKGSSPRCPQGVGRATCEAALHEGQEQTGAGDQTSESGLRCPRALSHAQCRELEEEAAASHGRAQGKG